ncbi:hypothetical protein AVEN_49355-1 [Araneus ventricosus]|uniref:Uncharacterized protein n=1 Tax=Araneus ventricosus TaxID=182803 RepID=A0A4Y2LRL5_ARAVE|nr:hypothetical protein AVEN_49355-1 [Araneus ventricosus]
MPRYEAPSYQKDALEYDMSTLEDSPAVDNPPPSSNKPQKETNTNSGKNIRNDSAETVMAELVKESATVVHKAVRKHVKV